MILWYVCCDGWHARRILKRAGKVGAATGSAPQSFRSLLRNPQSHVKMTDVVFHCTSNTAGSHALRLLSPKVAKKAAPLVSSAPQMFSVRHDDAQSRSSNASSDTKIANHWSLRVSEGKVGERSRTD